MPAPRTGSIARNATSQTPFASASTTLPAASKVTNSIATPSRLANSRASSAETPRGSPLAGSFCASTELPKLIAARSLPVGASSFTTLRGTLSAMAAPHTSKEESMQEGRRGERLGHAAILEAGQDYPSVLALQGHTHAIAIQQERSDGQDHQNQSRRYFQAVFELLACGDGRGRAEARVLPTLSRPVLPRATWLVFSGLNALSDEHSSQPVKPSPTELGSKMVAERGPKGLTRSSHSMRRPTAVRTR